MPPPHVGARHDHRSLRAREQFRRDAERPAVGLTRGTRGCQRARFACVVSLAEHVIHREVDEGDAGRSSPQSRGGQKRVVDQSTDRVGRARGGGEPGQRSHERHMVDLLQRTLAPSQRGRPATEHQQR